MKFQWDQGNIGHCQKHGLLRREIEWIIVHGWIAPDAKHSSVEERFKAIGVTRAGRFAFAVFTYRDGLVRPVSARYMHGKEVARWLKSSQG